MNLNLNHHPFVLKPQAMIMWVQPSLSSSQSCLSSSNCSPMTPLCPSACVIQLVVDTLLLSTCLCYSTCSRRLVKLLVLFNLPWTPCQASPQEAWITNLTPVSLLAKDGLLIIHDATKVLAGQVMLIKPSATTRLSYMMLHCLQGMSH